MVGLLVNRGHRVLLLLVDGRGRVLRSRLLELDRLLLGLLLEEQRLLLKRQRLLGIEASLGGSRSRCVVVHGRMGKLVDCRIVRARMTSGLNVSAYIAG